MSTPRDDNTEAARTADPPPPPPSAPSHWFPALPRWSSAAATGGILNSVPTTAVGVAGFKTRSDSSRYGFWPQHAQEEEASERATLEAGRWASFRMEHPQPPHHADTQAAPHFASYESHPDPVERSAVRFHDAAEEEDDDEQAEAKAEERNLERGVSHLGTSAAVANASGDPAANTAPMLAPTGLSAAEAARRARLKLDSIEDPEIRLMLDPDSSMFLNESTVTNWPKEKVIKLIQCFEPEHIEGLLKKLRRGMMHAEGTEDQLIDEEAVRAEMTTSMSWRNLFFSTGKNPGSPDSTLLLQNVSGYIKPGQLLAVLGGPDAGVTTLLDVLSRRVGRTKKADSQLLGDIFVNRRAPDFTFDRQVGYVAKGDTHLPQLTVSETIGFSAKLRNPNLSRRGALVRTALIMKMLGLLHTWFTPVGDDLIRGISGGEKRRLSFALELVAGHNLVIADLPTNGLDSASALSLVQVYKSTTVIGRSLLCSLVQPSPDIFALLDLVCVLSKGACIYFGPPQLACGYFEALGFPCPPEKSQPQFLEELSAAPERFYNISAVSIERNRGGAGAAALHGVGGAARKSVRPLLALMQQEEQIQRSRARLMATRSFGGDGSVPSQPQQQRHTKPGSRWPDAHAVIELAHRQGPTTKEPQPYGQGEEVAASASAVVVPIRAAAVPDPSLSSSPPATDSHLVRFQSWNLLVSSYAESVFADDVGWVLYTELTPVPSFFGGSHTMQLKAEAAAKAVAHKAAPAGGAGKPKSTKDGETAVSSPPTAPAKGVSVYRDAAYQAPFRIQFLENFLRLSVLFYRDKGLWAWNFLKSIVIGLLIGTLFYQLSLEQQNVRTRFGLFYFCLTFSCANAQQLIPVLLSMRRVFALQYKAKYYSALSYYLALVCVNIPLALLETFLFIVIVYPLAGLHGGVNSATFGYCLLMLIIVNLVSRAWVLMLVSLMPTEALTNIFNGISLVIFSLFSGYLNPKETIPAGWIWSYYVSYFTWSLRGLLINEQLGLEYKCDPNPLVPCLYPTGESALQLYDMVGTSTDKWLCLLWMALFLVGFNVLAVIGMTTVDMSPHDREEEPDFLPAPVQEELDEHTLKAPLTPIPSVNNDSPLAPDIEPAENSASRSSLIPRDSDRNLHRDGGYISWRNLCYTVQVDGGEKTRKLLNNVCGYATPGMMVALMGASGAGKTTLLDVLAARKTGGEITGDILVNGLPSDESFMRVAGYVEQFDSHNEKSTVAEAIRFSAMMRLPASVTDDAAEVERRVTRVMSQLALTRLSNELIGNAATSGISQSARKRVTIAVELIADPKILFLDEPTTGLDAAGAIDVIECVSQLRATGLSIICTVHQPSSQIISHFSHLLLLQPGGKVVYFGELEAMPSHFAAADVGLPAHIEGDNLADYAIRCVKQSTNAKGEKLDLQQSFNQSSFGTALDAALAQGVAPKSVQNAWRTEREILAPGGRSGCVAPFGLQFRVLWDRFHRSLNRSPDLWFGRIFAQLLMGFIISTCYFQLGSGQSDAQNRVGAMFLCVQFVMGSGALKLPAVFSERAVVFRETQSHMYEFHAYYLARWVSDLWLWALENIIFVILVYFTCNLNSTDGYARMGLFYLLLLLTGQLGFSQSELIALLSPTPPMAYTLQGTISTIFSLFSGFLISKANMPVGWAWFHYVSPNRYPLTAGLQNEMRGAQFTCAPDQTFPLPSPMCDRNDGFRCPVQCGNELLTGLGVSIDASDEVQNFCLILVFIAGWKLLGYFAFRYVNHIRR